MVLRTALGSNVPGRFGARAVYGSSSGLPQSASRVMHFSADTITPQSDNTSLTTWVDQISGLSATQATGANQPKYRTSRSGGKPAVQFNGSQWLAGSFPTAKTTADAKVYTVMIVYSNVIAQANGTLFGNGAGGDSFCFMATGTTSGRYNNNTTALQFPYSSTNQMTMGYSCQNTARYPQQTNTNNERVYAYGMCVTTYQPPTLPSTTSADGFFAIGATNSLGQLFCKADIQEIVMWNRVLTEMEWLQAESWVANKYSQTIPWTTAPYIYIGDGDSLSSGVGSASTQDVSKTWTYLTAQALGLSLGQWSIQAIGGMTTRGMTLKIPEWSGIGAYCGKNMKISAFEWYNEKNNGYTAAVAYADMMSSGGTYGGYAPTVKAIPNTKLCLGTSTSYNGDPDPTNRDTYNASMDAGHALCDAYVAIHNDTNIGITTAYTTNGAGAGLNLWFDTVHLNAAGYAILAPLMTTGMQAM